ncbi:MAG: SDR family NAD(P)-dependent oxidoreductase [Fimbriimonadaceae bacterium]|nr:SDR family NAD(P)-dependent oxidoreductase [Fimbriimonadaceae bacterium]
MSWNGRRVLVTGAGGFIGSHLAERLFTEGAQVRALVHYNGAGRWGWLDASEHAKAMDVMMGDIADPESVLSAAKDQEVIFHLAALIAIPYSYHAPRSYVRTNVEGTLNVLEAARRYGTSRVVNTSTSETYGTAITVPISEDHPMQGQSPYSASKIGADMIADSYYRSFEIPVVTARPFNTFGPRQSARAVIPTIMSQLLSGQREIRLGALHPTRDLNYVTNTVEGFLAAGSHPAAVGQTFNFGTGREISVMDLAELIAQIAGREIEIVSEESRQRPPASEVERLLADATRARTVLGWHPRVDLEEGLERTLAWVEKNLDRYRPGVYTI